MRQIPDCGAPKCNFCRSPMPFQRTRPTECARPCC
ncbi:hypothetical protein A2U01_0094266, partial [Trifolium medium]|nr:hypothetical protein [Trifolium medium]